MSIEITGPSVHSTGLSLPSQDKDDAPTSLPTGQPTSSTQRSGRDSTGSMSLDWSEEALAKVARQNSVAANPLEHAALALALLAKVSGQVTQAPGDALDAQSVNSDMVLRLLHEH